MPTKDRTYPLRMEDDLYAEGRRAATDAGISLGHLLRHLLRRHVGMATAEGPARNDNGEEVSA